jgi:hypothetical protein
MRRAALFIACIVPFSANAGYHAATLAEDGSRLQLTTTDGRRTEAPRLPDQVGFGTPRRSRDGRYVGWLAMFDNCCTSYPIALKLVVLDEAGRMHTFEGDQLAIFDWCFRPVRPASPSGRACCTAPTPSISSAAASPTGACWPATTTRTTNAPTRRPERRPRPG